MEGQKIHCSVYDYIRNVPEYCPKAVIPNTRTFWTWDVVMEGNTWVEEDIFQRMLNIMDSLKYSLDKGIQCAQDQFIELEEKATTGK